PSSRLLTSPALRPHLGGLVAEAFHHEWRHPDPRMDALQAGVAALTARAAAAGEDAAVTFARVRRAADDAAGAAAAAPAAPAPAADRRRPPRLTEAWFC